MPRRAGILAREVAFACCIFALAAGRLGAQILPQKRAPLQPPQGTGACSIEKSCAEVAPEIIQSALGVSPLKENLRYLTMTLGARVSGSAAADKAADWAVEAFRHAGVDEVKTEDFTIASGWAAGKAVARVIAPVRFPLRIATAGWSAATPQGGITARVIDVGSGDEAVFARVGAAARGAIVLVRSRVARNAADIESGRERDAGVAERAGKAGAAAILWMSNPAGGEVYRLRATTDGTVQGLPQAVIARGDAERIGRLIAAGRRVRVHVEMPNRVTGAVKSPNVVAEIRGREKPDEFVLVAAQLDSWDMGQGALDGGCNAAMLIDAARAIHSAGTIPRRSIRFVLFTGQEQGMLGSWAYMQAHRPELDGLAAAIDFARGDGRITGFSLNGRRDALPAVSTLLEPIRLLGVANFTLAPQPLSEALDFLLEGVPTLVPVQQAGPSAAAAGTPADTFDKVNIEALKRRSAIAAISAFALADSDAPIAPRQTRSEIEHLLEQTGLAEKMKRAGYWWQWQTTDRGRRPSCGPASSCGDTTRL
ncbi:MAG TPA: M28 family peptidase [Candidatus Acidoferrales bacterium]|nr:M28 family peptidase [Candidatus Acidoferrales bacterium]